MSLLLEALRKAERAKASSQGDGEPPPAQGESFAHFSLERSNDDPPSPLARPQLPRELEILDEDFLAGAKRKAAPTPLHQENPAASAGNPHGRATEVPDTRCPAETLPSADTGPAREIARRVFAAKRPSGTGNRASVLAAGLLGLGAVAAIGLHIAAPIPVSPTTIAPGNAFAAPAPPAAHAAPPLPAMSVPAAVPLPPATERPVPPAPFSLPPAEPRLAAASRAATTDAGNPIRITRSWAVVNPLLQRAFDALGAGETEAARTDYAAVLRTEPRNPDALHGMAAIALQQGRHDVAEELYRRAVEADPKNAIAQAGLVGLRGEADPTASESRLKNLIAAQPDQHFLQFALGNLHAAAGRWNEAQHAFFKAHTGDPDQPDYLFNLAVSLDHLRQPQLAARYYGQALAAATTRAAGFDRALADARLHELQPRDGIR